MPTLHASHPDLHVPLARLALDAGLLPIARQHAELAASQQTTDACKVLLGRVRLREARVKQERALGMTSHAAEALMDPRLGARLGHAHELVEAGDLEMARAACLATLSAWPAAVRGWLMLACIDAELGDLENAGIALEQALRCQPHHAAARRMLHVLSRTRALQTGGAARRAA